MAAPSNPRGQGAIVDLRTGPNRGQVTPAPATRPVPRPAITPDVVSDPAKLRLFLAQLQQQLDDAREQSRNVFVGALLLRGLSLTGGVTTVIEHKLGREPLGVLVTAPMVTAATAAAGTFAVVRQPLPTGRDPKRFVAMFAHETLDAVDLLIF